MRIPVALCRRVVNSDPEEFSAVAAVLLSKIDALADAGEKTLTEEQVRAIFGEYTDMVLRQASKAQGG